MACSGHPPSGTTPLLLPPPPSEEPLELPLGLPLELPLGLPLELPVGLPLELPLELPPSSGVLTTLPPELLHADPTHADPTASAATARPCETKTLRDPTRRLMVLFLPGFGAATQKGNDARTSAVKLGSLIYRPGQTVSLIAHAYSQGEMACSHANRSTFLAPR